MGDPNAPLTPAQIEVAAESAQHEGYLHRVFVQADDLAEVALGGKPGVTVSSETEIMATEDHGLKKLVGEVVSDGLDLIEAHHGRDAEVADKVRAEDAIVELDKGIATK